MNRKLRRTVAAFFALLAGLMTGCDAPAQAPETTQQTLSVMGDWNVYCFQAGKADAFLLWNEDSAVLIDTGESGFGKTIVSYMQEQGITKLDLLIITHFDKDHVGGAKKVLESVEVARVLQSNVPKESSAYSKYLAALEAKGLTAETVSGDLDVSLGDLQITVNGPTKTDSVDESNNSSLIVSVFHGADKLLFMGDAEDERIAEFVAQNQTDYDWIKIPYHGHWQDGLQALLKSTSPETAVITSSSEEPEDEQTLDLLAQYGIAAYLTREGAIRFTSTGSGVTAQGT